MKPSILTFVTAGQETISGLLDYLEHELNEAKCDYNTSTKNGETPVD